MLKGTLFAHWGWGLEAKQHKAVSLLHCSVWGPGHGTERPLCSHLMNTLNGKSIRRLGSPPQPPTSSIHVTGTFQGSRKTAALPDGFLTNAEPTF